MRLRNYIGGHFVESRGDSLLSLNPSSPSDRVAEFGAGAPEDAQAAVAAAKAALEDWRRTSAPARAEFLMRWASVIADQSESLAQATAREVGKPISEARGEAARCVAILRYFAGEALRPVGEVIPAQTHGPLQYAFRQPLGVCGLITPWNFPLAIPIWKAAPALAFGNTVVLKPAEASSHVGTLLAETAMQAGLPYGTFNVLLGAGAQVGQPLLEAGVDALSFTGSQKVGLALAELAARHNVKFQGEMGGKNAAIVLEDADLDRAASLIAGGAFRYAGQKCTATSRLIAVRQVVDAIVEKVRLIAEGYVLGPVDDPRCAVGPMISEASRERALAALGGQAGAARVEGEGYFIRPAMVRGAEPDDPIAQEELFAPVLTVIEVSNVEEAIAAANATRFGLSASLFTNDLRRALNYAEHIQAGLVRVNGDTTGVDPHAPFGGMKGSSTHSREQGPAAVEFYTEIKTVQINP